jgi:hypothetical protein
MKAALGLLARGTFNLSPFFVLKVKRELKMCMAAFLRLSTPWVYRYTPK